MIFSVDIKFVEIFMDVLRKKLFYFIIIVIFELKDFWLCRDYGVNYNDFYFNIMRILF